MPPSATHAASSVSGAITADTVWSAAQGPYEVTGDVSVENGATLTIEAGVTAYFSAGASLVVKFGALRARGTASAPIVLTSARESGGAAQPGDWGQLRLLPGTVDADTLLEHVQVRYGQGIVIQSASPALNYLTIANNSGAAISVDLESSPAGVGNRAMGNAVNGVQVPAGDIGTSLAWKLKGIPYVVPQGIVSVGQRPTLQGIAPGEIEQGETLEVTLTGARLAGAETVAFGNPGVTGTILAGATATTVPVRVAVSSSAVLGPVAVEVQVAAGTARLEGAFSVIAPKPPIVVSAIAPDSIRRGETGPFQVSGEHLNGASVSTTATGLTVGNVQSTATQVSFTLSASGTATLGTQALTIANPAVAKGTATVQVTVLKEPVKVYTAPSPIAVPPDLVERQIRIRLSEPDTATHGFTATVANATVAKVSPSVFSIPAGAIETTLGVTGLKAGDTTLTISSATLATVQVPLVVTAEYINFAYTPALGVTMPADPQSQPSRSATTPLLGVTLLSDATNQPDRLSATPLLGVVVGTEPSGPGELFGAAPLLGVVFEGNAVQTSHLVPASPLGATLGPVAFGLSPSSVAAGGSATLVVQGSDLDGVTGVEFSPAGGIAAGTPLAVSADGKSVSVPITLAPAAGETTRAVVLITAGGKVRFADPAAGQLRITPSPQ